MTDDAELLRRYAKTRSEMAFTELVERHAGLVYHAAFRRTGHAQMAQETVQRVFIALAKQAGRISHHAVLAGWLYTTTRFTANNILRAEHRRRQREAETVAMLNTLSAPGIAWDQLRPAIDGVMDKLPEPERNAVLLRFFEGRSFAEVGRALQTTEEAARKRVVRGVERMRSLLARKGIASTSAALAGVLSSHGELAAPAGVATAAVGPAMAAGAASAAALGGGAWFWVVLAIPLIGGAAYTLRLNAKAQADLSMARGQLAVTAAKLRDAERQVQSEAREPSDWPVNAGLNPIRSRLVHALPAGAPRASDPFAEGRRFLHAFPQARNLLMQTGKVAAAADFYPFFRSVGFNAGQIDKFETHIASLWIDRLGIGAAGIGSGATGPDADWMSREFGPDVEAKFRVYTDRLLYPYKFTTLAAAAANEAGMSLSGSQANNLAEIMAAQSSPHLVTEGTFGSGNAIHALTAVDWKAVLTETKELFPAGQFNAVQGALLMLEFDTAGLEAQRRQAVTGEKP